MNAGQSSSDGDAVVQAAHDCASRTARRLLLARLLRCQLFLLAVAAGTVAVPLFLGKFVVVDTDRIRLVGVTALATAFIAGLTPLLRRPTIIDGARRLDVFGNRSNLRHRDLVLTAVATNDGSASPLRPMWIAELERHLPDLRSDHAVRLGIAPILRVALLAVVVDVTLAATPVATAKIDPQIASIGDYLEREVASLPTDMQTSIASLESAQSTEELAREADRLWRDETTSKSKSADLPSNTPENLRRYVDAVLQMDVDKARSVAEAAARDIEAAGPREDLAAAVAATKNDADALAHDALDDTAKALRAGRGASLVAIAASLARETIEPTLNRRERMRDILLTVYARLGRTPPSRKSIPRRRTIRRRRRTSLGVRRSSSVAKTSAT